MRIIAVGGVPGTGKTTLMKKLIFELGKFELKKDVKLVPYLHNPEKNLYILGEYPDNEVFGGTDKMSMACQPEVIKWLNTLPSDSTILFEGDRLFNNSFLTHCQDNYDLKIVILDAKPATRDARYKQRGSEQNETWLSGRVTKVKKIQNSFGFMDYITLFSHEDNEDTKHVTKYIMEKIDEK